MKLLVEPRAFLDRWPRGVDSSLAGTAGGEVDSFRLERPLCSSSAGNEGFRLACTLPRRSTGLHQTPKLCRPGCPRFRRRAQSPRAAVESRCALGTGHRKPCASSTRVAASGGPHSNTWPPPARTGRVRRRAPTRLEGMHHRSGCALLPSSTRAVLGRCRGCQNAVRPCGHPFVGRSGRAAGSTSPSRMISVRQAATCALAITCTLPETSTSLSR